MEWIYISLKYLYLIKYGWNVMIVEDLEFNVVVFLNICVRM